MNGITNFAIRSSFSLEIIYEFIFLISLVIFLTRKMFLTLKKKKKKKKKSPVREVYAVSKTLKYQICLEMFGLVGDLEEI